MNRGEQIRAELTELMRQCILLLDGAMGTVIQARGLTEADYRGREFAQHAKDLRLNNEVLNLSQPQMIEEVHRAYLDAGADIIETNTFNGNAISMAEYGLKDRAADLSRAGARKSPVAPWTATPPTRDTAVTWPGRWARHRGPLPSRRM